MTNETAIVAATVIDIFFVYFAFRSGKSWLMMSIVINLLLVSTFGAKLITIFGFTTNAGNVFFASAFLGSHLLIEHYGKEAGYKMAWMGLAVNAAFLVLAQLVVLSVGDPSSAQINQAIDAIFRLVPRIAFASLVGYLLVQTINTWLYDSLKRATEGAHLWIRDQVSNVACQLIDSVLFFSIAFLGTVPVVTLLQIILVGFICKVAVGALGLPVMYLSMRKPPVKMEINAS